LKEDNNKPKQINIQSKIIFNQEFDVNDQLVPFYQKIYKKTNRKYVISKHQFKHFSNLPPFHSAGLIIPPEKTILPLVKPRECCLRKPGKLIAEIHCAFFKKKANTIRIYHLETMKKKYPSNLTVL